MDLETCAFWLDAIAGGAVVLWLAAAVFLASAARRAGATATGTVELPGAPADVTQAVAAALVRGSAGTPLQTVALDEVTDNTVVWHARSGIRHQGSLRVERRGAGVRVDWELRTASGLITAGRWVSALGLLVIAGVYWLLLTYALPSQHPAVRGQVFQMFQAVHVLWPPFLLGALAVHLRKRLVAEVERRIHNQRWSSPRDEDT